LPLSDGGPPLAHHQRAIDGDRTIILRARLIDYTTVASIDDWLAVLGEQAGLSIGVALSLLERRGEHAAAEAAAASRVGGWTFHLCRPPAVG
jgi:hypothetical protein